MNTCTALNLDKNAIAAANAASQHDAGNVIVHDAERTYARGMEIFEPRPEWNDQQRAFMAKRAEGWKDLCEKSFNDALHKRAAWVPWTVAGPARYDSRKNGSRADADLRANAEWAEKRQAYLENSTKALFNLVPDSEKVERYRTGRDDSPISADDPLALEKLAARIEYLKEEHAQHLALNKYYRKHKTMHGAPGISDERAAKLDAQLECLPECMRVVGFPSNETATIRRLEERLASMEKARAVAEDSADTTPETFEGFRIERDTAANRVRIYFDEKPDEDTRALLKGNGFRWSPSAGAWQRQLNANGISAAHKVAGLILNNH